LCFWLVFFFVVLFLADCSSTSALRLSSPVDFYCAGPVYSFPSSFAKESGSGAHFFARSLQHCGLGTPLFCVSAKIPTACFPYLDQIGLPFSQFSHERLVSPLPSQYGSHLSRKIRFSSSTEVSLPSPFSCPFRMAPRTLERNGEGVPKSPDF